MMIEELMIIHPYWIYAFIALFALSIGSLLNVIIYRLPLILHEEWQQQCCELLHVKKKKNKSTLNLFFPRSFCPHCKSMIKAWQNIPLISYLILRRRCTQCHEKISIRYPFIECLCLILSLYACWHFGFTSKLVFALIVIYLLICLFFIDLDHQLIPDSLSLSLLWLGLIANTQTLFCPLPDAVFAAVGGYLSLWIFIKIYYLFTGKIGMGHGDFKLFAALGAWFGWIMHPLILLISALSGALSGLIYLRLKNQTRDKPIPLALFYALPD